MDADLTPAPASRWELYRLLGEPARLRLLALTQAEELSVGELAELLSESQPNVSRHVAPLRKAGLLKERKQGTRVYLALTDVAARDAVVADALVAGRKLVTEDGSLAKIPDLLRAREAQARDFFGRARDVDGLAAMPPELPAYLTALAPLLPHRRLAVDVGTGDGALLDLLAPIYDHVVAVDREDAQLARAKERCLRRGYDNVELVWGDLSDLGVRAAVRKYGLADAVFASRVLHHAPRPTAALKALASLVRTGGHVIVLDYAPHEDERLQKEQADVWLGFSEDELVRMGKTAGLVDLAITSIPLSRNGSGPDRHIEWQVLSGRRPKTKTSTRS